MKAISAFSFMYHDINNLFDYLQHYGSEENILHIEKFWIVYIFDIDNF